MPVSLYLLPVFVVFMFGDVYGRENNNKHLVSIFQPGTTAVVLMMALMSFLNPVHQTGYTLHIAFALIISIIADGILVDRNDPHGFVKGMVLFLIAIIAYGYTWTKYNGFHKEDLVATLIALVAYAGLMIFFVKKMYKDERGPTKIEFIGITIYLLVFCLIISRAALTFYGDYFSQTQAILMTTGISLFFMGDCQLGTYHFIDVNFPMTQAPPFYFIGQLLIGLSCCFA